MNHFLALYERHGPDVPRIASALHISQAYADRLVNAHMDERYLERKRAEASE